MEKTLVSAIITTHNRKKLLMRAIESVLTQTYKNIECIVVDDASTDKTQDDIQLYINSGKIQYIYIEPRDSQGGNHARNVGIYHAKGQYIAFLDDDDEWFSDKIEKQVREMERNAETGFVYCGVMVEKNLDKTTWKVRPNRIDKYLEGNISKEILIRIITTTTTIMVKRGILEEVGYFDENLNYWQEYELCIRILQKTQAKAVREPLALYRVIDSDKNRLSNKMAGWEKSVKYIEQKHKSLIALLNKEEEAYRKAYIYIDGFLRGRNTGNIRYMGKYVWLMMKNREVRKVIFQKAVGTLWRKK